MKRPRIDPNWPERLTETIGGIVSETETTTTTETETTTTETEQPEEDEEDA